MKDLLKNSKAASDSELISVSIISPKSLVADTFLSPVIRFSIQSYDYGTCFSKARWMEVCLMLLQGKIGRIRGNKVINLQSGSVSFSRTKF